MVMVGLFLAIWFSWMGFTLYANRFDTDDLVFRLAKLGATAAIAGCAASASDAAGKYAVPFAASYLLGRLILLGLYGRAWRHVPDARPTINVYLVCVGVSTLLWAVSIAVPGPGALLALGGRRARRRRRAGPRHPAERPPPAAHRAPPGTLRPARHPRPRRSRGRRRARHPRRLVGGPVARGGRARAAAGRQPVVGLLRRRGHQQRRQPRRGRGRGRRAGRRRRPGDRGRAARRRPAPRPVRLRPPPARARHRPRRRRARGAGRAPRDARTLRVGVGPGRRARPLLRRQRDDRGRHGPLVAPGLAVAAGPRPGRARDRRRARCRRRCCTPPSSPPSRSPPRSTGPSSDAGRRPSSTPTEATGRQASARAAVRRWAVDPAGDRRPAGPWRARRGRPCPAPNPSGTRPRTSTRARTWRSPKTAYASAGPARRARSSSTSAPDGDDAEGQQPGGDHLGGQRGQGPRPQPRRGAGRDEQGDGHRQRGRAACSSRHSRSHPGSRSRRAGVATGGAVRPDHDDGEPDRDDEVDRQPEPGGEAGDRPRRRRSGTGRCAAGSRRGWPSRRPAR